MPTALLVRNSRTPSIRLPFYLLICLASVSLTGCAREVPPPAPVERWSIHATLSENGVLEVAERIEIGAGERRPFPRTVMTPSIPGAFLAHAALSDVTARRLDGGEGKLSRSSYGNDRTTFTYTPTLEPEGAWGFELSYRIYGLVDDGPAGGHDRLSHRLLTGQNPWPVKRLAVTLDLPVGVARDDVEMDGHLLGAGFREFDRSHFGGEGATFTLTFEDVAAEASLLLTLTLPGAAITTGGAAAWLPLLLAQGAPLWWFSVAFLLISLALLVAPVHVVVAVTRLWHFVILALLIGLQGGALSYWFFGRPDLPTHELLSSALSELAGAVGIIGFIGFLLVRQVRDLQPGARAAWGVEVTVPVAMLAAALYIFNEPPFFFLWLATLPLPLYWVRRRVALWFGAASHLIVERVAAGGRVAIHDLARDLGISEGALVGLLARQPELPLVVDHDGRAVLSAAAAAQQKELAVCPSCGGATETGGQDLVSCRFCKRSYAESRAAKPQRPVPFEVEAIARVLDMAAWVAALWGATLFVVGIIIEALSPSGSVTEGLLVGAVIAALLGGLGFLLHRGAGAIRGGRGYATLRVALLLFSPLVVPFVALRRLSSRAMQLHFGRLDEQTLATELAARGELSFAELAGWLGADLDHALTTARYLAANDRIPAVYDRVGARLVHRDVWSRLAEEGACRTCGGEVGVLGGQLTCQHCGATP